VTRSIKAGVDRFRPEALLVGESCTAELIRTNRAPSPAAMGLACGVNLERCPPTPKRKIGALNPPNSFCAPCCANACRPPGEAQAGRIRWKIAKAAGPRVEPAGARSLLGLPAAAMTQGDQGPPGRNTALT